jgi:hypothetical protein
MNRAFIPLAAAATFAAVYQLTPVAPPAPQGPEAVEMAAVVPVETAAPVVSERRANPPRASRRRRAVRVPAAARRAVRAAARPAFVFYSGCNEVRAAGLAPLYRGQPGYRPEMDGDDDGIACEPHRRRG